MGGSPSVEPRGGACDQPGHLLSCTCPLSPCSQAAWIRIPDSVTPMLCDLSEFLNLSDLLPPHLYDSKPTCPFHHLTPCPGAEETGAEFSVSCLSPLPLGVPFPGVCGAHTLLYAVCLTEDLSGLGQEAPTKGFHLHLPLALAPPGHEHGDPPLGRLVSGLPVQ